MDEISDGIDPLTDWGVPNDWAAKFRIEYDKLNVGKLDLGNVWHIFKAILDHFS